MTTILQYKTNDLSWGMFDISLVQISSFFVHRFPFLRSFQKGINQDTYKKKGRKIDTLSCWLPLLHKDLLCSWKMCLRYWHACLKPSICQFESIFIFLRRLSISQVDSWTFKTTRGICGKANNCNKELAASAKAMVDTDTRVSLQETAVYLGINLSSISKILSEKLGYRKMSAEWVPHVLTPKARGVVLLFKGSAYRLQKLWSTAPWWICKGDETWLYMHEPRRKSQNKAWVLKGRNPPQIVHWCHPTKTVPYNIFFNSKGVMLQKPCKPGQMITGKFYRDSVLWN